MFEKVIKVLTVIGFWLNLLFLAWVSTLVAEQDIYRDLKEDIIYYEFGSEAVGKLIKTTDEGEHHWVCSNYFIEYDRNNK